MAYSKNLFDNVTSLKIKLKPGAKKDSIELKDDGSLAIAVTSRPIAGKANEHLISLLSKKLHIPKSLCRIKQGLKSRDKVISVEGLDRKEICSRIKVQG